MGLEVSSLLVNKRESFTKKALFSPLAKKVETVQNTPSVLDSVEWKIMSSNYKNNAQEYTNFHSGVA